MITYIFVINRFIMGNCSNC